MQANICTINMREIERFNMKIDMSGRLNFARYFFTRVKALRIRISFN